MKSEKILFIALALFGLLVVSQAVFAEEPVPTLFEEEPTPELIGEEPPIFCTMDAKVCEDGSSVGRDSNNNCEFYPCPGETVEEPIVGGDIDEHGCIGSAGYVWCADLNKCVRPWEDYCESWEREIKEQGITVDPDPEMPPEQEPMACTEEAKVCQDGETVVVRNPYNNCEFEPCPEEIPVQDNPEGTIGISDNPQANRDNDATAPQTSEPEQTENPIAAFFNAIISFFTGLFN